MPETFANAAVGNLNASILIGATSLVLQAGQGALFPATGNFRIVIGTEIIIVGARSGDTLSSLTRGAESTAAAAHNSADVVTHELTAGALGTFAQELAYVERTTSLTTSQTVAASADVFVTASAVTFDGSTRVKVEAFVPEVFNSTVANYNTLYLFEDGSVRATLGRVQDTGTTQGTTLSSSFFFTPASGSRTYSLRIAVGGGTGQFSAGSGTVGGFAPAFLRLVRA